jgi:hypothetical protein
MAEFSYESDIAPMRGSYFTDPSISSAERRQLTSRYASTIAPLQEASNKTLERALDIQNQEISFQRQKLDLEKSKEEAKFLLEANSRLGSLTASLGSILNDKSKDTFGKAKDIVNLQIPNASLIARDPTTRALFDSALKRIDVDSTKETLQERKKADRLQLMTTAAQLGDTGLISKLAGSDMDDEERARLELAGGIAKQNSDIINSKAGKEANEVAQKQATEARDLDLRILSGHEAALRSMKPPSMSEDEMVQSLKKGELPSPDKMGAMKFNELDSIELKEIMMDLNPSLQKDPSKLEGIPTSELYRSAFRALNRKRNRYLPTKNSNTSSLFSE